MQRAWRNRGFTLVELLVVITIIAILIALLLPAVQMAREAARAIQCSNNIKQLALGCVAHESAVKHYPTGGWGWGWTGDADRGTDWRQPGGWMYNILPFIELQSMHDLGGGTGAWNNPAKLDANLLRMSTSVNGFYCPSRRIAKPYPAVWGYFCGCANANFSPSLSSLVVGRSDYAANGGDMWSTQVPSGVGFSTNYGPGSNPDAGPADAAMIENPPGTMTSEARSVFSGVAKVATGIVYCGSMVKASDVTDGTSNTFLLGEKYVNPDCYETGTDYGDSEYALMGANDDVLRWTQWSLMPDRPGDYSPNQSFGSAHPSTMNMAFCDGAVRPIDFKIDLTVYKYLGNRKDGIPIDACRL